MKIKNIKYLSKDNAEIIAKLGFNIPISTYYDRAGIFHSTVTAFTNKGGIMRPATFSVSAPTLEAACNFLHSFQMFVTVMPILSGKDVVFRYMIYHLKGGKMVIESCEETYSDYREALYIGLDFALSLFKI